MYLDLLDVHLRFTSPWPPSWFAFFFLPARSESADGCHKRPEEWGDGTRKKKLNCREFNIQAQQERNILVSPSSPSPSLFKKKQNKSKIRRQPLRAVTVKTWKRKKKLRLLQITAVTKEGIRRRIFFPVFFPTRLLFRVRFCLACKKLQAEEKILYLSVVEKGRAKNRQFSPSYSFWQQSRRTRHDRE